jgi:hypothetical protein
MHHALIVGCRVVAGLVGLFAFYLAFFLYEDEEGVWQNRVESLWIAVYDRAKTTDSTSAAIFNKIGETLKRFLNFIFGDSLLSTRAAVTSVNLSLVGSALDQAFGLDPLSWIAHNMFTLIPESPFLCLAAGISFALACLPHYLKTKTGLLIAGIFPFTVVVSPLVNIIRHGPTTFYEVMPVVVIVSVISNYVAITVIRRLFALMSKAISMKQIFVMILALLSIAGIVEGLPPYLHLKGIDFSGGEQHRSLFKVLTDYNFMTGVLCVIPAFMLLFLLLHKVIWPLLSRAIYSLYRNNVIANRKVLISVGCLCLTFALNIEQVGAKELLKLLS